MLKEHLGRSFSSISFDFRFWILPKNSVEAMISLMRSLGYRSVMMCVLCCHLADKNYNIVVFKVLQASLC